MSLRIGLADDQALVREELKAPLQRLAVDVLIEAEDGAALLAGLSRATVDVIVSDVRMPSMDGIAMLRELRRRGCATPVILLTTFDDDEVMLAAVEAGAQGFLMKGASAAQLRDAIERVHRGEHSLSPVTVDPLRVRLAPRDATPPNGAFTGREVEVLRLLAGGYSNKEIARSLDLAEGTVKNYVSDILAKLGTRDRTRAVLKAITLRIV